MFYLFFTCIQLSKSTGKNSDLVEVMVRLIDCIKHFKIDFNDNFFSMSSEG